MHLKKFSPFLFAGLLGVSVWLLIAELVFVPKAVAAAFVVDSTGDAGDNSPGNGTCETAGGVCTLRAAVEEANALAGADFITFDGSLAGSTITLNSELLILEEVEIAGLTGLVVQGSGGHRLIRTATGDEVRLSFMTLQKGAAPGDKGGGILNEQASLLLTTMTLVDHSALNGGAVANIVGKLTLNGVTVENNSASGSGGQGGGIYSENGTLSVEDSSFKENLAGEGGGAIAFRGGEATVLASSIDGNSAPNGGGLLVSDGGVLTMGGTTVSNNSGETGGGLLVDSGAAEIGSSLLSSNTAGISGGGLAVINDGTAALIGVTVNGNEAARGGGLAAEGGSTLLVSSLSDIRQNQVLIVDGACSGWSPASFGGGIYSSESDVTLLNSTVQLNTADVVESCPTPPSSSGDTLKGVGGGLYTITSTLAITSTGFLTNTADIGGGLYLVTSSSVISRSLIGDNQAVWSNGGGIFQSSGRLTLQERSFVQGNTAASIWASGGGGGIYSSSTFSQPLPELIIVDSDVESNTARFGGGIFNAGILHFSLGWINDNTSTGVNPCGGGLFNANTFGFTNATIIDSSIRNNRVLSSNGNGGGICNEQNLTVQRSTFYDNVAGRHGGGIYNAPFGQLTVAAGEGISIFQRNEADPAPASDGGGGGIFNRGRAEIMQIIFTDNTAGFSGGGVQNDENGRMTIRDSSFNAHSAQFGGAIYQRIGASGSPLEVINTTISGNAATFGGGVSGESGEIALTHVTLNGNSASFGDSIYNPFDSATITVTNSIAAGGGSQCSGGIIAQGGNLSSDATCAGFTITNTDPDVEPFSLFLAQGGLHRLRLSSPARGTASLPLCTALPANDVDARGAARTVDGACDLGAYEINYVEACRSPFAVLPDNFPPGVDDTLTVSQPGVILDLDVYLKMSHDIVGDIVTTLTYSTTTPLTLLDRPGLPASPPVGCLADNVDVTLDSNAGSPAENACSPSPPAIGGRLSPADNLATYFLDPIAGDWTLNAADLSTNGAGSLDGWCLQADVQACPTLPPPDVTAELILCPGCFTGDYVEMNWPAVPGSSLYRIHRTFDDPYFTPAGSPYASALGGSWFERDYRVVNDTSRNTFYAVESAVACTAGDIGPLERVGVFHFALTPGTP